MYNTKKSTVNGLGALTDSDWTAAKNALLMAGDTASANRMEAEKKAYNEGTPSYRASIEKDILSYLASVKVTGPQKAADQQITPAPTTTSSLDLSRIDERYLWAGGLIGIGAAYWLTKKMVMPLVVAAIGGAIYYKMKTDQKLAVKP